MVTLRRGPRLKRQCTLPKEEQPVESAIIPKKKAIVKHPNPDKENKTAKNKVTDKKLRGADIQKRTPPSQMLTLRNKKSRLEPRTVSKKEVIDEVLEVGRNTSGSNTVSSEEIVIKLSNPRSKRKPLAPSTPQVKASKPIVSECVRKTSSKASLKGKTTIFATTKKVDCEIDLKPDMGTSTLPSPNSIKSPSKTKSPLHLPMKTIPRSSNEIYKVPRASFSRKQKVSHEIAEMVESQERDISICSLIMDKKRKRNKSRESISEIGVAPFVGKDPSFAGISPIPPLISKREQEKLEVLEQSMNVFECPMSPIVPFNKDEQSCKLALKPNLKALPKRARTKPSKAANTSLLKTPIRQVFQTKAGTSAQNTSLFEESEESEEEGFSLYPLSNDTVFQPKAKHKTNAAKPKPADGTKMDYDGWLEEHNSDYDKFKDLELCIE